MTWWRKLLGLPEPEDRYNNNNFFIPLTYEDGYSLQMLGWNSKNKINITDTKDRIEITKASEAVNFPEKEE